MPRKISINALGKIITVYLAYAYDCYMTPCKVHQVFHNGQTNEIKLSKVLQIYTVMNLPHESEPTGLLAASLQIHQGWGRDRLPAAAPQPPQHLT
jgi:hypothetical protein